MTSLVWSLMQALWRIWTLRKSHPCGEEETLKCLSKWVLTSLVWLLMQVLWRISTTYLHLEKRYPCGEETTLKYLYKFKFKYEI